MSDPPLLFTSKITDGDTRLEVLGWIIDTEAFTVTLPSRKRLKLRSLLAEWPPSRASASARQVSKLAGFLMHICLLYTSPSPRDGLLSRMPSSA